VKVIITDADAAMTSAVAEHLPNTVHLHCLWHLMKNVKKKCQGALGQSTSHLQGFIYACAYAMSENVSGTVQSARTGDHGSLRFCAAFVALVFFNGVSNTWCI